MTNKKILFFGCSHTAGDELSDDTWFPWKNTVSSAEEYYTRRNEVLRIHELYKKYSAENRIKAYPSLISIDGVITENHGHNGASLRECVYRCIREIELNNFDVAAVYLQLPPPNRLMLMLDHGVVTSMLSYDAISDDHPDRKSYVTQRVKLIPHYQDSVEDLMDLIMLHGYLSNKNIHFYLLPIDDTLQYREDDLSKTEDNLGFLLRMLKHIPLLDLRSFMTDRQLGHHFGKETHKRLAEILTWHIKTEVLGTA